MSEWHYHHCPECFEIYSCDMGCTIEPDLEDAISYPGKQFGYHCVCGKCEGNDMTQFDWDKYNGFIK